MLRHLSLIALPLCVTGPAPAHGQESGRFFVGLASTYSVLPTDLPASYLAELSGRTDVQGPSDPKDRIGFSARAGFGVSQDLSIAAVYDGVASRVSIDLAGTRTGAAMVLHAAGVDARKAFGGWFYVLGGVGALTLDPEARPAETSINWTAGVGRRDGVFRFELKDRMTVTTLGEGGESIFLHLVQLSAGFEVSL